ncbi:MAG: Rpn family recombination-promoting nuclease/putative transposase [Planctomycetota bacterium]
MRRRPHDALFRGVFGDPARAGELLRACLPRSVVGAIRWRHLRAVPGTFVDEDLREQITDLMFAAPLRHGFAHLCTVLEHRRRHARWIALRMHRYVTQHLASWAAQHPRARLLPPVLPLVIHQGPRPFRAPSALSQLIDRRGLPLQLRRHQPELRPFVFDLQAHDLGRMGLPLFARLPLLHLQQVPDRPGTGRLLDLWRPQLRELFAAPGGLPIFDRLVSYVNIVGVDDKRTLKHAYREIHPDAEDRFMTLGEKLLAEGRAEGRAEGEIKGQRKVLRRLLTKRFGDLPRGVTRRITAATDRDIDLWLDRLLVARTLADVVG